MTTEEKKRAALEWFNSHFCKSECAHYETIRILLQPSPVDAEVREAVQKASHPGHRIHLLMHDEDKWILSALLLAATKNMGDKPFSDLQILPPKE